MSARVRDLPVGNVRKRARNSKTGVKNIYAREALAIQFEHDCCCVYLAP